jgi:hypothetical protein
VHRLLPREKYRAAVLAEMKFAEGYTTTWIADGARCRLEHPHAHDEGWHDDEQDEREFEDGETNKRSHRKAM